MGLKPSLKFITYNALSTWWVNYLADFLKQWKMFWRIKNKPRTRKKVKSPEMYFNGKLENLSIIQVQSLAKDLSENRKCIQHKMDTVKQDLELTLKNLETLRLVKSEEKNTLEKIEHLTTQGQVLNDELEKINQKLKWIRNQEERLKTLDSNPEPHSF